MENDYEKNYGGFDPSSPEAVISILLGQEEYLDQSIMLASKIQDNFTNGLKRKNRGVKQAGLIVLHQTVMPSVLVEVGFLSEKREGAYLNSKKGQNDMAMSIKNAILDYKKELDLNVVSDIYLEDSNNETENTTVSYDANVTYKVQIAASSRKLALRPYNFKGLEEITREEEGTVYRYFYGETSDYGKVVQLQNEAKRIGYNSCFIVAFKNGKKVPLSDLTKSTPN